MTGPRRVEIVSIVEPPACPRCGNDGLLLARVPYGWVNSAGNRVDGRNGVVLCGGCHDDVPHAAALITWFQVNGSVEDDTSEEFARLLVAWAEHVEAPALDEQALEDEIAQWRNGDLQARRRKQSGQVGECCGRKVKTALPALRMRSGQS